jgi:hypothetical protein
MTLKEIIVKHQTDVTLFANGADLTEELYDDLYEYYAFTTAEMPYGTAKARDGDPVEWVTERFESDACTWK